MLCCPNVEAVSTIMKFPQCEGWRSRNSPIGGHSSPPGDDVRVVAGSGLRQAERFVSLPSSKAGSRECRGGPSK